jgi:hypothetical protein
MSLLVTLYRPNVIIGHTVSVQSVDAVELLIEIQLAENYPLENITLEIKDNCAIIGMHNSDSVKISKD